MKWLPWRSILRRVALGHGFMDPLALLARMQQFAQPSEVGEPIELLRAGVRMHARGLVNSRVIQNNLDWVWPYWVCRQVDPEDPSFLPRAFNITQINLTHRNWTAVGLPDCREIPIVDPRGLVTPHLDGWSLDGWIFTDDGRRLLPSRTARARQTLQLEGGLAVETVCAADGLQLTATAEVALDDGAAVCRVRYRACIDQPGWLVIALRPYNTEGISFIDRIDLSDDRRCWSVDPGPADIRLTHAAEQHHVSHYRHGDVSSRMTRPRDPDETEILCEAGMATAAAGYRLEPAADRVVGADIVLDRAEGSAERFDWAGALQPAAALTIPDERLSFLYQAALRTLVVLSPGDVYPGPGTYRRFWFRDAAFMVNALLSCGLRRRARRALDRFPERQNLMGYFLSQNGEWDSNGEALWTLWRWCALTGEDPAPDWRRPVIDGARWIARKRTSGKEPAAHAGLLPAGFSAEHLGPNDYYYWDDFWSVAGLRAAAALLDGMAERDLARGFRSEADDLMKAVCDSLQLARRRTGRAAMPASPYRRLDAGVIGSIVAGYPLELFPPDDARLLDSAEYLLAECLVQGGFFQDIIHSGINPYLTLHIAQILMRAGDRRSERLVDTVAELASPTGQWPEAIHPRTLGGCMGDGQHGWAAAEWVMAMRNGFVRGEADRLVLGAGVRPHWLEPGGRAAYGPAPTRFGDVAVGFEGTARGAVAEWRGDWREPPPRIDIAVPGYRPVSVTAEAREAVLEPLQ
jgi:hypothetical protein